MGLKTRGGFVHNLLTLLTTVCVCVSVCVCLCVCVSVKVLKGHVVFLHRGPVRSYKFLWKCAEMCQQHRKLTQDCLLLVIHRCRCAEQHHQSAALKL